MSDETDNVTILDVNRKLREIVADQEDEIANLRNPNTAAPPSMGFGTEEGGLASMDVEAFLNMRDWLQSAIEAKGAKMDGAGIGCGQADISFALDGCRYSVSIRPLPKC